jgi:hypothetical protein
MCALMARSAWRRAEPLPIGEKGRAEIGSCLRLKCQTGRAPGTTAVERPPVAVCVGPTGIGRDRVNTKTAPEQSAENRAIRPENCLCREFGASEWTQACGKLRIAYPKRQFSHSLGPKQTFTASSANGGNIAGAEARYLHLSFRKPDIDAISVTSLNRRQDDSWLSGLQSPKT